MPDMRNITVNSDVLLQYGLLVGSNVTEADDP